MSSPVKFDYKFPPELIARAPAAPRDAARLLIYDRQTGRITWDSFRNLAEHLPPRSVVVLNETKVIPARLTLLNASGGKVKILYLGKTSAERSVKASERQAKTIRVLANRRLSIGSLLTLPAAGVHFTVRKAAGKTYLLEPSFPLAKLSQVLRKFGETPLPPYIKHSPLAERKLRVEYQTIFAKRQGSVAAPTASLHFTQRLLRAIKRAGRDTVFVTLHVNLGTFAPVTAENLKSGKLHAEYYEISPSAAKLLSRAKNEGRPIVAVGTTGVRALESAADENGRLVRRSGETRLFIRPRYKFKFVDLLITNFHVPRSSLLMLVSAFVPWPKLKALYRAAIRRKFRLFSFGDGMLIK